MTSKSCFGTENKDSSLVIGHASPYYAAGTSTTDELSAIQLSLARSIYPGSSQPKSNAAGIVGGTISAIKTVLRLRGCWEAIHLPACHISYLKLFREEGEILMTPKLIKGFKTSRRVAV